MNENRYRHELKYLISQGQLTLLHTRLDGLLSRDSHIGPNGKYTITSLYFDDCYNRCYWENENGTDPREKFRIRIYNHSTDRIMLECKRKQQGMTLKTACPMTRAQVEAILLGQIPADTVHQPPLLQKLVCQMLTRQLHPVVIVEYERIPFIYQNGNVRITLDTNISSSAEVKKFLTGGFTKRPVMPVGQQLLEVKYDAFLPDFIYRAAQLENLSQTAYSKFYLCRKYSL